MGTLKTLFSAFIVILCIVAAIGIGLLVAAFSYVAGFAVIGGVVIIAILGALQDIFSNKSNTTK